MRFVHDERVELPHQSIVFSNGADPAKDGTIACNGDTTDAIWGSRFQDFLSRFWNRGPNAKRSEGGVQQLGSAVDASAIVCGQILNREMQLDWLTP